MAPTFTPDSTNLTTQISMRQGLGLYGADLLANSFSRLGRHLQRLREGTDLIEKGLHALQVYQNGYINLAPHSQ